MKINYVYSNQFSTSTEFDIEKQTWHDDLQAIQISNEFLDSLKKQGLDIHYELQYEEKTNTYIIYLDCHTFPYANFKNNRGNNYVVAIKKYYSEEMANKILNIRNELKQRYLAMVPEKNQEEYYFGEKKVENYLRLVYTTINVVSNEELLAETYKFIANTYPQLIKTLKEINVID